MRIPILPFFCTTNNTLEKLQKDESIGGGMSFVYWHNDKSKKGYLSCT